MLKSPNTWKPLTASQHKQNDSTFTGITITSPTNQALGCLLYKNIPPCNVDASGKAELVPDPIQGSGKWCLLNRHEMCSNMCWQEQSEKTGYRSSSRNAKGMTCYLRLPSCPDPP
ncbi:hypothetical protein EK904_010115 [Melospiza melodia maxima]|nr:hypothetical protein EK904_010115 [Melospiza melodia maxima]